MPHATLYAVCNLQDESTASRLVVATSSVSLFGLATSVSNRFRIHAGYSDIFESIGCEAYTFRVYPGNNLTFHTTATSTSATPLTAPTDLVVAEVSGTKIRLQWQSVDGATQYHLEQRKMDKESQDES